ncbi:MAG TPA: TonB-dependent receptor [Terriglobales bacterium]|nr:TonB-dependent receptor [Terriglobales bacterium]
MSSLIKIASIAILTLSMAIVSQPHVFAQASYTAQIRGVVTDQAGALVPNASVTITNDATNISATARSNDRGEYILTGLRPAVYSMKAEVAGFQVLEKKNVVLQVDQQTTINFELRVAGVTTEVQVTTAAPLLDTENASLGTDVTNEYVRDIPLYSRSMFGLVFLAAGVTETSGSGVNDNYPSGTNFVSNGQRNATAQVTLDGSPLSAPEQGEGGNSNVYYQPSVEIVQEFKVQNNSFSAEFGNNGGTVVNMVMKQGSNDFHGSGWWFGQRSEFDARDFFNTGEKPEHVRDQYGFSLGGPLVKNKTFFFVDFEKTREHNPINLEGIVPTDLERTGDFSQSPANLPDPSDPDTAQAGIYDPYNCVLSGTSCVRTQFSDGGVLNKIPADQINAIGQKILNLYPHANVASAVYPEPNFRKVILDHFSAWQFDVKLDHQITNNHKIGGRYSRHHDVYSSPTVIGNGDFNDGTIYKTDVNNGGLEYNWTISPTLLWTSRLSVDRVHAPGQTNNYPTLSDIGLPSILAANGLDRVPAINVDGGFLSIYTQCCVDTHFAHTLYSYSSALQWVKGTHSLKFGGEQRLFYNNFWQPDDPTGNFNFSRDVTTSEPNAGLGDLNQGNSFATILTGFPYSASLHLVPAVADKSKETAFYVLDDWKVTPKLTLNLGLRYEWSTPYSERYDRLQYSNFGGSTGISIPVSRDASGLFPQFGQIGNLLGTTVFPTSGHRNARVDRNNFAPRLGFAYQLAPNTVLRGGAGVFYGMNVATNYQYAGPSFSKTADMHFSKDNYQTQYATLSNPFPAGLAPPQGTTYGKLAQWGFSNSSDLDTGKARNAEIYQWNLGVQHMFPGQIVVAVDYSANRTTHLPWAGAGGPVNGATPRNRNYISSPVRNALVAALNPTHDPNNNAVSDYLNTLVPNPFQCFFTTVASPASYCPASPIFNAADVAGSLYLDAEIPQGLLLEPYPQFTGGFEGLPTLNANSWYHALQIRFQKRASHYISFEGNYTFSKATDDSSSGRNAWLGNLYLDNPQVLDNLRVEHGISTNDTPHRLTAAIIVDLPFGRDRWIGRGMNPVLDGIVGGWSLNSYITIQSGQPLAVYNSVGRLADGNPRPNVACSQMRTGLSYRDAAMSGGNLSYLNQDCFADPGDNIPGDAPRHFSNLRGDGIGNFDTSLSKEFTIREGKIIQVRAEMFNVFNHQRFAFPDLGSGDGTFGTVTSTTNNFRRMQFGARFQF